MPTTVTPPTAARAATSWNLELTLLGDGTKGSWTYAVLPDSAQVLGQRGPVKVTGTVDDVEVAVTLLPMGDGTHLFPVRAATRKRLGKGSGDTVTLRIDR